MDNNYKINTDGTEKQTKIDYATQNSALKKLNAFNAQMTKSDFNNSYTRYSIELKLIDEALKDLSENGSKKIIEQLTDRRQVLLENLRKYGILYKE